jgi:hypothetical protein
MYSIYEDHPNDPNDPNDPKTSGQTAPAPDSGEKPK